MTAEIYEKPGEDEDTNARGGEWEEGGMNDEREREGGRGRAAKA